METARHIRELRIVGGDPALDLANTVDGEPDEEPVFDNLKTYADLVAWGRRVGLVPEEEVGRLLREARRRPEEAKAVLARANELRGAIYKVFRAVSRGEDPPGEGLEALRSFEEEAVSRARLAREGGGFVWRWTAGGGDLGRIFWPVAHAAVGLLTGDELGRVKGCAGCRWLFVDRSKNQSRRWCSMAECGTNEKARRYVKRRAAKRDVPRR